MTAGPAGAGGRLSVAVDVGPLIGARTGIGQFTAELLDAVRALDGAPTLVPYVLSGRAPLEPGVRRLPYPARVALTAWGRFDHPSARRALRGVDVVHGTNFVVPPTGWPTVVTVHDCSPITRPDLVHPVVRAFVPVLRRAVARGAWVHTPSQFVADQVVELLGAPPERVRAIAHGAPAVEAAPMASAPWPAALGELDGHRYVLALATREPRKNLVVLVRAFAAIGAGDPDVRLALVGPAGSDDDAIGAAVAALAPDVRRRVVVHGYVQDELRTRLMRGASVLAYPSLDEGFGLPLVEAMAAGVPTVAARAGALPEVAGDASVLVDPLDVNGLAHAVGRVLADPAERERLRDAGRVNIGRFTWAATATAMVGLYRDAAMDTGRAASTASRRPRSRRPGDRRTGSRR